VKRRKKKRPLQRKRRKKKRPIQRKRRKKKRAPRKSKPLKEKKRRIGTRARVIKDLSPGMSYEEIETGLAFYDEGFGNGDTEWDDIRDLDLDADLEDYPDVQGDSYSETPT